MQLTHPTLLGLLIPVALLIAILERRVPGTMGRKTARWALRSAIAAAALLALAGPYAPMTAPRTPRLVVAIDLSADMDARARTAARRAARAAVEAAHRSGAEASVVAFAGLAGPARALDRRAGWREPEPPADAGSGTRARLQAGLAGAELAFHEGELGSILVLTSGRGDASGLGAVRARLSARGIQVHARAVPADGDAPTTRPSIVAVQSPEVVRGPFVVRASVDAQGEDVRVRLLIDGRPSAIELLGAGAQSEVAFDVGELPPGAHELGVALERTGVPGGDGGVSPARVDFARRLVTVGAPPRVLALLVDPEGSDLRRALSAQGMQMLALPPAACVRALTEGPAVDLVALDAASAVQLDAQAQQVLRERIRQGLGLLFEAGHDKAAWEALRDMPLADMLPLRPVVEPVPEPDVPEPPPPAPPPPTPPVDPPEDDEGPGIEAQRQPSKALPITLLLLIDRSASMHGAKLGLAIEGARRAAGALSAWDRVGVITFADDATLDFPPRSAAKAVSLPLWLSTVQAGGGTDIFRALRLASQVLAREKTPIQHVILLSDGKTGGIRLWPQVVGPMGQRGVTLTAVGIGQGHSRRELRGIIQWAARGSLVSVDHPRELPTVMTKDTRGLAGRRDAEAERLDRLNNPDAEPKPREEPDPPEPDEPEPPPPAPDEAEPKPDEPEPSRAPELLPLKRVRAHEAVRGFESDALPRVGPPRAAEPAFGAIVLLAREETPVLAARRFGLGRVLEWILPPEDAGGRAWRELGRLFGQGARAVMTPEGAFRHLPRVVVTPTPDGDRVHVEWPRGDATRVSLTWEGEDGTQRALGTLDPGDPEPSRMLPAVDGARLCRIVTVLEDGRPMLPLSYLTRSTAPPRSRAGDAAALERALGSPPADPATVGLTLPEGTRPKRRPLWPTFLWIAAFLLPLDVLVHRRSLSG